MVQYPLTFNVNAETTAGIQPLWTSTAPPAEPIKMGIPKEFDGPGGGLSPEDLYAMALQNCFVASFKVFAEKSRLTYSKLKTKGLLQVDRGEDGHPWMSKFLLTVTVEGASKVESIQRLLERTTKNCLILNSVKTQIQFQFDVQA